jgi:hypothetical protein
MKKSSILLASSLVPVLAIALATQSCSGGETANAGGTGGKAAGTGGRTGTGGGGIFLGSGGSSSVGTGGQSSFSTGGSSVGSGGSIVGAGGGPSAGSGGGTVAPGALAVTGGFVSNGAWMGYAFTSAFPATASTATIAPTCPTPCFPPTNTMLCANGTVGAEPTMAGRSGAILGFNINQAMPVAGAAVEMNRVPGGTGLVVTLSAPVPGGRIQIRDLGGNQWCYQVNPGGSALPTTNMVPWSMFNTMCYNTLMGIGYTMQPISQVQIVVPSGVTASPFNFCITDVHQY